MLNSILRRFRSKRARTNKPNDDNASHEWLPHASCSFCGTENMAARHSNRLVRIGSALSRSVVVSLVCVEVCRGLSSCRAVELDTLTPRRMQSGGALSYSVEVCRELSSSCQAILSSSCRVTVELLSSILSSSCRVSCRVVEARAQNRFLFGYACALQPKWRASYLLRCCCRSVRCHTPVARGGQ